MLILALDAASSTASVALADGQHVLAEMTLNTGKTHSEQLMPMVQDVLIRAEAKISAVARIAVTQGPGSFTGLRIGLATARALAQGRGISVCPVPTLDVLAEAQSGFSGFICPIMNARRKEVYTAIYRGDGRRVQRLSQFQAIPLQQLMAEVGQGPVLFTGDGVDVYQEDVRAALGPRAFFAQGLQGYVSAAVLARCAAKSAQGVHWNEVAPIYLRQSEAVIKWEAAHPGARIDD